MNHEDIVRNIFARTKYKATEEDIQEMAKNMTILEERGLGRLNQRLIENNRGIWATIAEHNFAVMLVSQHSSDIPISYEPEIGLRRPPDFRIELDAVTYWIQMKDLSNLERENRQNRTIRQIREGAREIEVGKFFDCRLSDSFKEDRISELISFMKTKATSAAEGTVFPFPNEKSRTAEIEFWTTTNESLQHLTLGTVSDMVAVDITKQVDEQIRGSLLNAVGAFDWEIGDRNINLISLEADNYEGIDISNALFGTEYDAQYDNGHWEWGRKNDGLFGEDNFSKKVAGIIVIRRKILKPVCDYHVFLYRNERYEHLVETISRLLKIDKYVSYNER